MLGIQVAETRRIQDNGTILNDACDNPTVQARRRVGQFGPSERRRDKSACAKAHAPASGYRWLTLDNDANERGIRDEPFPSRDRSGAADDLVAQRTGVNRQALC
jgi:hypothetical protein